MKRYFYFIILSCIALNSLILCGCITKYDPPDIDELADILVVEGIITDDETAITLTRSVNLKDDIKIGSDPSTPTYVTNAIVKVECEDGTQFQAGYPVWVCESSNCKCQYKIKTGKLNPNQKYWLNIEIEEIEGDCNPGAGYMGSCPTKTYKYSSDPANPIQTPEIDSVFWMKRGKGQPVSIHVATHSPDLKVLYYRWSYKEDWEVRSEVYLQNYPYFCWNYGNSSQLLLGSAEKTVFGRITDKLTEMPPSSSRLSALYRIDVKQNVISKRAYDYFTNIKKNAEQSGSIFAPVPSELRGNITCITDPGRPVIGYVDISTTTQKRRYISSGEVFEKPRSKCDEILPFDVLKSRYEEIFSDEGNKPPTEEDELMRWIYDKFGYVVYQRIVIGNIIMSLFVKHECVDCTLSNATTQKPDDWPNNN